MDKHHVSEMIDFMKAPTSLITPESRIVKMVDSTLVIRESVDFDICHVLHLYGNPTEGCLVCYIEIFSFFRIIVFMNLNYDGPAISESWGYNLLEKKAFQPKVEFLINNNYQWHEFMSQNIDVDILSENYEKIIDCYNKFHNRE